jgi:hypothetical protein
VKQVGRELGVRYVLEGSVRKAANRVRVSGQLIDASTGMHIRGDRFEGPLENIFDSAGPGDGKRHWCHRVTTGTSRNSSRQMQADRNSRRI